MSTQMIFDASKTNTIYEDKFEVGFIKIARSASDPPQESSCSIDNAFQSSSVRPGVCLTKWASELCAVPCSFRLTNSCRSKPSRWLVQHAQRDLLQVQSTAAAPGVRFAAGALLRCCCMHACMSLLSLMLWEAGLAFANMHIPFQLLGMLTSIFGCFKSF